MHNLHWQIQQPCRPHTVQVNWPPLNVTINDTTRPTYYASVLRTIIVELIHSTALQFHSTIQILRCSCTYPWINAIINRIHPYPWQQQARSQGETTNKLHAENYSKASTTELWPMHANTYRPLWRSHTHQPSQCWNLGVWNLDAPHACQCIPVLPMEPPKTSII